MSYRLVIAEKPSVGAAYAKVLGATNRQDGYWEGNGYLVSWCILTHEKSSLAPPGVSLAFSLGDEGGFRWVGEYDITADEMLSGIEPQRETKTQQAKDLICALLAGGKQVLSEDIDKAALERGIPGRTVRDAKRELGDALKSKIVEGRKKVFWME